MTPGDVKEQIRLLVADQGRVTSGEVARAAGISRQGAHYHLAALTRSGELARIGRGRGSAYVRAADFDKVFELEGLEEHLVWNEVNSSVPRFERARENVGSILAYAFTEMLNNAIEHSAGNIARVVVPREAERLRFEILDDGIGVFRHVREQFGLESELSALQELSKGKLTTAPAEHTGEGIFFTSKLVDTFELDSGGLIWVVDNLRGDQAVGDAPKHAGTRVGVAVDPETQRTLEEVFGRFTDPETFRFASSRVSIRLFESGEMFVSRSEARRLTAELDRFDVVELDFEGVRRVGQGFIDEIFRVWAASHPQTRLVPINMSPTVQAMVERGRRSS